MIYFDVSTLNPEKITGVGVYMMQLLKHFHQKNVAITPVVKASRFKKIAGIAEILPYKKNEAIVPMDAVSSTALSWP